VSGVKLKLWPGSDRRRACHEERVTTPPAKAGGFSDKLCGNPLAWRPKADIPARTECPEMHNLSRRNVAIQNAAAVTAVHPFVQSLWFDRAAFRARLACSARIDENDMGTGAFSLIPDELDELRPRGVVNGPGQHSALEPGHVEVFKGDAPVARDQGSREFVQVIAPLTGDPGRSGGEPGFGRLTAFRAPFASGESTLPAALGLLSLAGVARRLDRLAIARGDQAVEAKVNPDRVGAARLGEVRFHREDDEPLAVLTRDDAGSEFGVSGQVAMPNHFEAARNADDPNPTVFLDRQAIADAERGGVVAGRCPVAWEATLALEEGRERLIHAPEHLLQRRKRPSSAAVRVGSANRLEFGCLVPVAQGETATAVGFNPLLKAGVVEAAEVPEHGVQRGGLLSVRAKSVFVRADHSLTGRRRRRASSRRTRITTSYCFSPVSAAISRISLKASGVSFVVMRG
jgi:hypothetical protein